MARKWWKHKHAFWQHVSCSKTSASTRNPARSLRHQQRVPPRTPFCPFLYSKMFEGRVIDEPSPPSAPERPHRCCVRMGNTVLNYKIRNVHVERFFKIKLYTNWSLLNYPTNIPQTRQQNNQPTTKSTNTKWKSSSNYCNGNESSENKLTSSSSHSGTGGTLM